MVPYTCIRQGGKKKIRTYASKRQSLFIQKKNPNFIYFFLIFQFSCFSNLFSITIFLSSFFTFYFFLISSFFSFLFSYLSKMQYTLNIIHFNIEDIHAGAEIDELYIYIQKRKFDEYSMNIKSSVGYIRLKMRSQRAGVPLCQNA